MRAGWLGLLGALLLTACEEAAEAPEVPPVADLFVAHAPLDLPAVVVNDLGYRIEVDRWVAVSASIELRPCEASASLFWQLFGGTAAAHVTPTIYRAGGSAQPRDLLGAGAATLFGQLTPPAGDYCQVRYASSPADADIEGSGGGGSLLGKSMVISGRYRPPGSEMAVPFSLETTLGTRVDLPEIAATSAAPLFRLRSGERLTVTVTLDPAAMFDGIDFALQGPAQVESQLVFNLARGMELELVVEP
jgi:hypothetical protein